MATAALTSDATAPGLARFADGEALAKLRYSLSTDQQNGFVSRGPLRISPRATLRSSTTADIDDCLDSTQWLKYKQDGTLKDGTPAARYKANAVVTLAGGAWKVTQLTVGKENSC